MHRGFKLELKSFNFSQGSFETGRQIHSGQQKNVSDVLDKFVMRDGKLDGSKMQANWFPQIECDVFVSHSHVDESTAISLAGWLKNEFGLVSFIDSCAWGYSGKLLRLINDAHCKDSSGNYIYEKLNLASGHVHMMLSTALSKMLDKSECVFFLNTPNSILPKDVIGDSASNTKSPWIYSEIEMTRLIRRRSHTDHRGLDKIAKAKAMFEDLSIQYAVRLNHLTSLDNSDLIKWRTSKTLTGHALDILYALKPESSM